MGIRTDFRITDDACEVVDVSVWRHTDDDENDVITISQDGHDVTFTIPMGQDLVKTLTKLLSGE